jgi:hypothetical protein
MSNALRFTPRLILEAALLALAGTAAAHAAEPPTTPTREPGTLSQEATSAGPAVDTSAMPAAALPASGAPSQSTPRRAPDGGPQAVTRPNSDRLELDTTVVTGNRELPKVLYIVPWKKSDLGDLPAQPFNTLLDEALAPVDRDVFRREVTYYGAVSNGGDGAANAPAPQAERSEK